MITSRPVLLVAACTAAAAFLLTGCSGSSKSSGTGSKASSGSTNRPRFNTGQMDKIQQCLKAAGISVSAPSGRPSNLPSNLPSGMPSNFPSDFPSNVPSGFPSGARPGGGAFSDPKVQQALKACGISLPTFAAGQ